ncbi:hypothetical protein RhiLY_02495 [Ceratobasidium sp. AG-Ba]|nr:hypothetical protein RhiLY_02495 [Ceratobasidium sp. AG-Ba]
MRLESGSVLRASPRDISESALEVLSSIGRYRSGLPSIHSLSPEQQKQFESDLCKLWVANGFAWHAINQPQTQIFFQKWLPEARLPDRQKLSGDVLLQEVEHANASMREAIRGRVATGMSDGWKNIKRNYLVASMLSVDHKASNLLLL